ncbi:unnamed protein product [Ectocarpus sp. 13 AM-2016]
MLDNDSSEVDATNGQGWAALHCASSVDGPVGNNGDAVRVLLGAGADVDVKTTDDSCFTPLHLAVNRRIASAGTIRALVEGGANVHAGARRGNTPLHTACKRASVTGVELLLRWGADEKLTNSVGKTPADMMRAWEQNGPETNHQCLLRMLARAPADRSWRRRSWLVLCRSCPTRVQIANRSEGGSISSSSSSSMGNSAKVARVSVEGSSLGDEETEDQTTVDLRDLAGRLVGLEDDGLFRLVVGFL